MSYIDATLQLSQYGAFVGGATPLRSTVGTGHVPVGFQAEIIDGQYYPDRPLPISYRPLENPFGSSLPIINAMQDNYGTGTSPLALLHNFMLIKVNLPLPLSPGGMRKMA